LGSTLKSPHIGGPGAEARQDATLKSTRVGGPGAEARQDATLKSPRIEGLVLKHDKMLL